MEEPSQRIDARTEAGLLAEYRDIVCSRVPMLSGKVKGALVGLDLQHRATGIEADLGVLWILRAQQGTTEKLTAYFSTGSGLSSVELLAVARNLFENLVWLQLFRSDNSWGVHFYGQFLKNQIDDLKGMIKKLRDEVSLFEAFDAEDHEITDQLCKELSSAENDEGEEAKKLIEQMDLRRAELDRRARRTFALYAASAKFNGYGFQAKLIETKALPAWEERLRVAEKHKDEFKAHVGDDAKIKRYLGPWQWRNEAAKVGMADQYDFLYRLTSRLLHATPMNMITEKELLEPERIMLLEYIVVTAEDILDAIEDFDFPGRMNLVAIEMRPDDVSPD